MGRILSEEEPGAVMYSLFGRNHPVANQTVPMARISAVRFMLPIDCPDGTKACDLVHS